VDTRSTSEADADGLRCLNRRTGVHHLSPITHRRHYLSPIAAITYHPSPPLPCPLVQIFDIVPPLNCRLCKTLTAHALVAKRERASASECFRKAGLRSAGVNRKLSVAAEHVHNRHSCNISRREQHVIDKIPRCSVLKAGRHHAKIQKVSLIVKLTGAQNISFLS
jgi:hypothetical protein